MVIQAIKSALTMIANLCRRFLGVLSDQQGIIRPGSRSERRAIVEKVELLRDESRVEGMTTDFADLRAYIQQTCPLPARPCQSHAELNQQRFQQNYAPPQLQHQQADFVHQGRQHSADRLQQEQQQRIEFQFQLPPYANGIAQRLTFAEVAKYGMRRNA